MLNSLARPAVFACTFIVLALIVMPVVHGDEGEWRQLFNGKDLEDWTPKIVGHAAGENFGDTFRVEDGLLRVSYENYEGDFAERFGHLFYNEEFGNYRLRVEYRIHGEQAQNAPSWALRNSGVMLHGQQPQTMQIGQSFPVSIEAQLLAGDGTNPRPTANLCTPGTNVVRDGQLFTTHCVNSSSKTYHGDQWVTVEFEVHGSGAIRHLVEGEVVMEYEQPQLDERDPDAKRLLDAGAVKLLSKGTISLQSEGHPVDFRKVELLPLTE